VLCSDLQYKADVRQLRKTDDERAKKIILEGGQNMQSALFHVHRYRARLLRTPDEFFGAPSSSQSSPPSSYSPPEDAVTTAPPVDGNVAVIVLEEKLT
jgi:hypothetical protein